jgi:hypothetical protein
MGRYGESARVAVPLGDTDGFDGRAAGRERGERSAEGRFGELEGETSIRVVARGAYAKTLDRTEASLLSRLARERDASAVEADATLALLPKHEHAEEAIRSAPQEMISPDRPSGPRVRSARRAVPYEDEEDLC